MPSVSSGRATTVYSVGEALARKPDCARCGLPYHKHNIGALVACPIIATYLPKDPTHAQP